MGAHVEVAVDEWNASAGVVPTVGGNTSKQGSGGSDDNGGGVWPRTRTRSEIVEVVRWVGPMRGEAD